MKKQKITYSQAGVNYIALDAIKKTAQQQAKYTAKYLLQLGFPEVSDSRGESAFVWEQSNCYMASVVEGLGTKSLVANAMLALTNKTYYDVIGHDTVATIINDLVSVGAKPLVIHAYFATGSDSFLTTTSKMSDLITGWKLACDIAEVTWGGGETPTQTGIIEKDAIDLGGSSVGIIKPKSKLLTDTKLKEGDRILLLQSNGINANGVSLARAIAKRLPKGYGTKLSDGKTYGEHLLTKTNLYAKLVENLLDANIAIHYISNITGHGLRKVMRARQNFTYVIESIFEPQEVFVFMQKHAGITDEEAYGIWNMGMDYAIFLPEKNVKKAQTIITKSGFESINAGYIEKGEKQVIIQPKNITFSSKHLDLR